VRRRKNTTAPKARRRRAIITETTMATVVVALGRWCGLLGLVEVVEGEATEFIKGLVGVVPCGKMVEDEKVVEEDEDRVLLERSVVEEDDCVSVVELDV
jgi:hypothetical protein